MNLLIKGSEIIDCVFLQTMYGRMEEADALIDSLTLDKVKNQQICLYYHLCVPYNPFFAAFFSLSFDLMLRSK